MTDQEAAVLINQGSNKGKYVVGSPEYETWRKTPQYFDEPKKIREIDMSPGSVGEIARRNRRGYNMIFNQKSFKGGDTIYAHSDKKSNVIAKYNGDSGLWQLQEKVSLSTTKPSATGGSQSVSKQQWINIGEPTTLMAIQRGGQLGYTK